MASHPASVHTRPHASESIGGACWMFAAIVLGFTAAAGRLAAFKLWRDARGESPVLVDCLGTWLTGVVDEAGWDDLDAARAIVRDRAAGLVESLCAATVPVVVVTNEVGWSLVPTTASGRFFQDELGRLNALVAGGDAAVR